MNKRNKDYLNYIPSALIYEFCLVAFLTLLVVVSTSNEVLIKTLEYVDNSLSFWSFFFPVGIGFILLFLKDQIIFQKDAKDKISEVGADLFETLIGTFRIVVVTLFSLVIVCLKEYGWNNKSWFIIFFAVLAFLENSCFLAFKRYKTRPKF
ncbi:hypothetical protein [Acinetobacter pollinis]|uniref:hypothetical protein n=1 Tax=Acinetobacter pollinis TaxID=2605270 RepID=UPI0018A2F645|nr:hypothetical protein [Acinetobacter pollinis]MBF7699273.1 hypothetical protein [Acinetobacter pollinis]